MNDINIVGVYSGINLINILFSFSFFFLCQMWRRKNGIAVLSFWFYFFLPVECNIGNVKWYKSIGIVRPIRPSIAYNQTHNIVFHLNQMCMNFVLYNFVNFSVSFNTIEGKNQKKKLLLICIPERVAYNFFLFSGVQYFSDWGKSIYQ